MAVEELFVMIDEEDLAELETLGSVYDLYARLRADEEGDHNHVAAVSAE